MFSLPEVKSQHSSYYKQHQERSIRNLKRRAAQLGLRLEPIPSSERVS